MPPLYPNYRIDLADLADPAKAAWRQDMADRWSNALANQIQRTIDGKPQDMLSIMVMATTDALATCCVTDPDGYEATAKRIGEQVTARLLAVRYRAERSVGVAYTLQQPKGAAGDN